MGKVTLKSKLARRGVHFRRVNSWVEVARVPSMVSMGPMGAIGGPFVACVKIGYGNVRRNSPSNLASCAKGKNPRAAIAAAMRKAATRASGRRGAYAGYRR